ncbi:MAG: histidinol dehydrogenase [Candidatus Orphnella occulta]|nr:histidinol dehydrogenase [Candidatus Orphnella occulta]MDP8297790.1 histidinol dehydrogenase [Candidatus Orphnella occulta]
MKSIKPNSKELVKLYNRGIDLKKSVRDKVSNIIEGVQAHGDEALVRYTKQFDNIKIKPRQLKVTTGEVNGAYQNMDPNLVNSFKVAIENVAQFYKKQLKKSWKIKDKEGIMLGERITPLESVGIYIPAGTAPLASTVYMTVLPAKIAGVKRIVIVTPPNEYGNVHPYILVMANLLGITEIYKVGGAQAVAALAFGTKSIPRVDKIVGPGNQYVSEAKRQVFGYVGIDMVAGPSEVVIVADDSVNCEFVAADMAAQCEHLMGLSILITKSKRLVKFMQQQPLKGYLILVKSLKEAAEIANKIAPEHLQLMVKDPKKLSKMIQNAGCILLGEYTPTALSDYIAGPSHVLPTGGSARFFSGLSIWDFLKGIHVVSYSKRALESVKDDIERIASLEGLNKHIDSIKKRFE